MKLGLGEVEQTDSDAYARLFTHTRFLIVAEKIKPRILNEARLGPFPHFHDLISTIPTDQLDEFCADLNKGWRFLESVTGAGAFLGSLKQWVQKWSLDADWCIDRTIMAMRRYSDSMARCPTLQDDFSWFYPLDMIEAGKDGKKPYKDKIDRIFDFPILDLPPTEIRDLQGFNLPNSPPCPGGLLDFDPYLESLEGYLSLIEREARRRLEIDPYLSLVEKPHQNAYATLVKKRAAEYAKQVMAYALSQAGLKKVKTKHELETHLEWAVRVWVLGQNYSQVAHKAARRQSGRKYSSNAIRKAVREVLQLIEPSWVSQLEERFPPGRPRAT